MCVIIALIVILNLSLTAYNNPIFAFNSYSHYNKILSEGFDDVADIPTFVDWTSAITNLLYFEEHTSPVSGEHTEYHYKM